MDLAGPRQPSTYLKGLLWIPNGAGGKISDSTNLEKEMATHSSILARRIPWTEEPSGLQSMGLQRVRHNLVTKPPLARNLWPDQQYIC